MEDQVATAEGEAGCFPKPAAEVGDSSAEVANSPRAGGTGRCGMSAAARNGTRRLGGTLGFNLSSLHTLGVGTFSSSQLLELTRRSKEAIRWGVQRQEGEGAGGGRGAPADGLHVQPRSAQIFFALQQPLTATLQAEEEAQGGAQGRKTGKGQRRDSNLSLTDPSPCVLSSVTGLANSEVEQGQTPILT